MSELKNTSVICQMIHDPVSDIVTTSDALHVDHVERDSAELVTIYTTDKLGRTVYYTISQELVEQIKSI